MWRWFRKRRALRAYKTTLATKLRARYGRETHYTPDQVRSCASDAGLSMAFVCFAIAMYCDRAGFDTYHLEHGEVCDYAAMRAEAGTTLGLEAASHDTFDASHFIDAVDHHHHDDDPRRDHW